MIYDTFEQKIIPYYYSFDEDNIPKKWVAYIKNTIAMISPHFTMKRQLDDYFNKYYNHMIERVEMMAKNDCEACKEYSAWKLKMRRLWNSIELISYQVPDSEDKIFSINDHFKAKVCLYLGDIDAENVGVEMIITHKENDKINSYARKEDFVLTSFKNQKAEYTLDFNADVVGVHDYAFRIYPKHPLMPFREDLPLIKWI
jgi:hypothetical protein